MRLAALAAVARSGYVGDVEYVERLYPRENHS
jgi:hypothetical protein